MLERSDTPQDNVYKSGKDDDKKESNEVQATKDRVYIPLNTVGSPEKIKKTVEEWGRHVHSCYERKISINIS